MCTPYVPQTPEEFKSKDNTYTIILVSIWEMEEGICNLIITPISEKFETLRVWLSINVIFCLTVLGGALSTNTHMLVTFRFLSGLTVIAVSLEPAIVSDLF